MPRLLAHLAKFSAFASQGELLCTQSLVYLLQHDQAREVFAEFAAREAGVAFGRDLTWRAEVRHLEDLRRPDLEACSADKTQVVKIEAKLDANLLPGQLRSYVNDIEKRCGDGRLLVLFPRRRQQNALSSVRAEFGFSEKPWQRHSGCNVAVIHWEGVIEALRAVSDKAFQNDLEQFEAMYAVLNFHVRPLATDIEAAERQDDLVTLVDLLSRRFTEARNLKLLPRSKEDEIGEDGKALSYQRRYICMPLGGETPCFSIGIRHPFTGKMTFIWLRFHRTTNRFLLIHSRLFGSPLRHQMVESGGHVWLPLDLPLHTEQDGMLDSLNEQLEQVVRVAYAPLD